jgi:hypothetical protein
MRLSALFFVALWIPAGPAAAQDAAAPSEVRTCALPAGTLVEIAIAVPIGSKTAKNGDNFPILVAKPVVVDGLALVPERAEGVGEVVHSKKQKPFSTGPGELILAARRINVGGVEVPLRSFRMFAVGAEYNVVGVSSGSAYVYPVGENVEIPAGSAATAKVAVETMVPCPATPENPEP